MTKNADINEARLVANWHRIIAWLAAIPTALATLGWLSIKGYLEKLPSGPADEQFIAVASRHLVLLLIVGSIVYHGVLAINLRNLRLFLNWLKERN